MHRVIKLTYIQLRCKTSEVVARYRMSSTLLDLNLQTSRFTGARRAMFGRSARARATDSGSETLHVPTMGSKQPRTALVLCRETYICDRHSRNSPSVGSLLVTTRYKLAAPRTTFFWPAFVTRNMTPRSRKSGYGLPLGYRSPLDAGHKKHFFLTMFEKIIGQKPGKSSSDGRARHRN